MISISRVVARQFRAVARRAGLCKGGSSRLSGVRIVTTVDSLSIQASNGLAAVEFRQGGQFEPAEMVVPMQLLVDCEANDDGCVTIRPNGSSGHIANWADRGVPQHKEYSSAEAPAMHEVPQEYARNPPGLLIALRDAKASTKGTSTRYALDCVQLDGVNGTIAATDSHQLLIQSGFQFPWQDQVLMTSTDVFRSRELPADLPVEIGRTESGVTVRIGAWTVYHEVLKGGRYPNVDQIIPKPATITTRMQMDEADAQFLADTLVRLPADDQTDRPLTLDLNGSVMIRARKDAQSPMMELLLSRSRRIGVQLRLQTNRTYLARAVELGFKEVGFANAESPCVCQDATRTYVWMLLENKGALEPSTEALRIDSVTNSPIGTEVSAKSRGPSSRAKVVATTVVPANRLAGHLTRQKDTSFSEPFLDALTSLVPLPVELVEQAQKIRDQLRNSVQGLNDLISLVRQQRRQARLMKSTVKSLKQLQLLEA